MFQSEQLQEKWAPLLDYEGLADTQKEKRGSLSESVEFASEAEYREKLETLNES